MLDFIAIGHPKVAPEGVEAGPQEQFQTGQSIDHIGFETKNLEAFTKKLEAQGIKLDRPYTKVPKLGIAIAFIKDLGNEYRNDGRARRRQVGFLRVQFLGYPADEEA